MALKGLLNSIVHSNSNKAVLVHSWPLTRGIYIYTLTYPGGPGDRFGVYIYIYAHQKKGLALNADLDNTVFSDTKLYI